MIVVSMLNQKGGVGKTSSTYHLGGTLAALGHRVLLVDNDPQASLSQGVWGQGPTFDLDPAETIAAVYRGEAHQPAELVRPTDFPNLSIVAGSEAATLANVPDLDEVPAEVAESMRDFLGYLDDQFDYVLIDCPPNLYLCSYAALIASDFIIIPLQPEDYSAQGIDTVMRSIQRVQYGPNPALRLLGLLLTRVSKKALHVTYEGKIRASYGEQVFKAVVPDSVTYCESIAFRQPISTYRPKGQPALRIKELAGEFLARIESMTAEEIHQ